MKSQASFRPPCESKAFTIIEILVATAVTALLVTLMLSITTNILGAWNRSSGNLLANSQARTALDELTRDLQSAVIRRDGNVWMAATISDRDQVGTGDSKMPDANWNSVGGGKVKPGNSDPRTLDVIGTREGLETFRNLKDTPISVLRFGQAGMWFRFFSTPPDAPRPGSVPKMADTSTVRAISYQIVRRRQGKENDAAIVYQLFRSEAVPGREVSDSTFSAGYNLFVSPETNLYNYSSPPPNGHKEDKDNPGESVFNIHTPADSDVIANNVIDFGLRFYDAEDNVIFPTKPEHRGYAATTAPEALPPKPRILPAAMENKKLPRRVEIMIRILTEEGTRLIQTLENPPPNVSITDQWWDIAEKHSLVFTSRVEIRATAY